MPGKQKWVLNEATLAYRDLLRTSFTPVITGGSFSHFSSLNINLFKYINKKSFLANDVENSQCSTNFNVI
jgi:hypothetical protein